MQQDLMAMLARQGYQIVPISNQTSPAPIEQTSSCASANNVGGLINGIAEPSVEVHSDDPTQEDLNTIGMLTEPTDCGLLIMVGGHHVEVAIGLVHPE